MTRTSDADATEKMKKKYAAPVPVTTVFTKKDCCATYSEVVELQQEFGLEYAAAIGSLIYLLSIPTFD
jgi:hypothetical protein